MVWRSAQRATAACLALAVVACASDSRVDPAADAAAVIGPDSGASPDASPGLPTDAAAAPDAADPCAAKASACPSVPAALSEGSGLSAVDRCAFPMGPGPAANPAVVAALEKLGTKVSVGAVLADANRTAAKVNQVAGSPAGLAYAFAWNAADQASTTWIPQGITGTPDADPAGLVGGKRAVLVSFYEDAMLGKGVRIAFVDVTTAAAPVYRFVLLVEPSGTAASPNFVPVNVHAGGMVWFGNWLFVADTGRGIRVFDMSRILEVAVDQDTVGCTPTICRAGLYKYVLLQVGSVVDQSACNPIYSWLSLDRSTSPPLLISGEYCSGAACASPLSGKIFRWPLLAATGLPQAAEARSWPAEAFFASHKQMQGGAANDGLFLLSSSAPAGSGGALYRAAPGKSATSGFADSPEDVMVDRASGWLWSLSEAAGSRAVFAVKLSSYPAP